ncbi:MAG: hypothetical protein ABR598_08700 [Candidatus Dormibacteria bacterium]
MREIAVVLAALGLSLTGLLAQSGPALARSGGGSTAVAAYDVSYPQCGKRLPTGGTLAIVGVTDGLPWSTNPCLGSEYAWAASRPSAQLYMNTANPETASSYWTQRAANGPKLCGTANLADPSDLNCAYNYGWNSAADALTRATTAIGTAATAHAWWLDVETANSWNGTTGANAQDLQGSIDKLRSVGVPGVGFYSTTYQWGVITGGWQAPVDTSGYPSDWVAGASNATQATSWCAPSYAFSGGPVRLVQYPSGNLDGDVICS